MQTGWVRFFKVAVKTKLREGVELETVYFNLDWLLRNGFLFCLDRSHNWSYLTIQLFVTSTIENFLVYVPITATTPSPKITRKEHEKGYSWLALR